MERIAWLLVIFMAGYSVAFYQVSKSAEHRVSAQAEVDRAAVEFAAAAKDPNGWDFIFNGGKK